ncbi:LOW QUALITY PROTEIN: hypothetical protein V2J09_005880 [Rumex salicifolius]
MEFRSLAAAGEGFADAARNAESVENTVSIIRLCLGDEVIYQVIDLKTSKHIGDKLEKMYMSKSFSCKLFLKQRLYGLKMSETSDLVQHVNTFNQIIGDLGRVSVKIDDEDQAMILPCSLTPVYETLLLTCGKKTISLETGGGLYTSNNQKKEKIEGEKSKSKAKKKVVYFGCGKTGQFKRTNRKLHSEKNSEGSSKSTNNDSSESGDSDMLSVTSNSHTDSWILDSGCSFHMTPHKEWFETYKVGNLGSVRLGDGKTFGIVRLEKIKVRIHDGIIITLTEVRTLHVNGFDYTPDVDCVKVSKGAMTVELQLQCLNLTSQLYGICAWGNIRGSQGGIVLSKVEFSYTVIARVPYFWLRIKCNMPGRNTLMSGFTRSGSLQLLVKSC